MRQSSKNSSAVSLDQLPIFFSFLLTWKPFTSVGKVTIEMPACPASGCVFSIRVMKSARVPLVMKVFEPLMT